MFEQTFKNIDDILWKDSGCSTELDYAEQSSWILFLKWLDDYEKEKETKASLENKKFKPVLNQEYQWSNWAIVKSKDGKVDFNKILTGPDLKKFVDDKLFPYLSSFRNKAESFDTLEYKIGEIFSELKNKLKDGYTLRDVINEVDNLEFKSSEQKYELSVLYEEKIKKMGNAGRNGGEYYTPRPLIKSIIKVIDPKVGDTVYDGAVGSAGFLVEAYEYMSKSKSLTTSELKTLQNKSFYGVEKKTLAYIIGIMNMILHGIESPNIIHKNTLETNIQEIQNKDRVDVILANPPFGGKEKEQIQENFPIKVDETAYLFLQHFIKKLKTGGRCGIVIKNTFLNNKDAKFIRKLILEECNLHTILNLPRGVFLGAGVLTVVLFFTKGKPTQNIWCYDLKTDRNLGKKEPINNEDLEEFLNYQVNKKESSNSWLLPIEEINKDDWIIKFNNPKNKIVKKANNLDNISKEIIILDSKSKFNHILDFNVKAKKYSTLGEETLVRRGTTITKKNTIKGNIPVIGGGMKPTYYHNDSNREAYTVTISSSGASAGFVNFWETPIFASDCTTVEPKNNLVNRKFLYYFLLSKQSFIFDNFRVGAAQPHVYAKDIITLEFPIFSIVEQNKIVEQVESLFTEIDIVKNDTKKKIKLIG